jgi:hypothetical protein
MISSLALYTVDKKDIKLRDKCLKKCGCVVENNYIVNIIIKNNYFLQSEEQELNVHGHFYFVNKFVLDDSLKLEDNVNKDYYVFKHVNNYKPNFTADERYLITGIRKFSWFKYEKYEYEFGIHFFNNKKKIILIKGDCKDDSNILPFPIVVKPDDFCFYFKSNGIFTFNVKRSVEKESCCIL